MQNALDAARLLPEGAQLHLVTHSRGGLIGELLCLNELPKSVVTSSLECPKTLGMMLCRK